MGGRKMEGMGGNFYYYLKNGFLVQVLEEECR